jgi:hypothetical protein
VTRDLGEKRLTGAVFLDMTKVFFAVLVNGLLWNLSGLNFPSYVVKSISSFLRDWAF